MSRRTKLLALFALAAVVAFGIPRSLTTDSPKPPPTATLEVESDEIALPPAEKTGTEKVGKIRTPRNAEYQPAVEEYHQYSVVLDTGTAFSVWLQEQRDLIMASSPEDIEEQRKQAESGDAGSAFWMFQYFDTCRHAPKTEWQLERSLGRVQQILDRKEQISARGNASIASQEFDEYEQGFRMCSIFGPKFDFISSALEWLELAADMGHMGAQRLYQGKAHQLLISHPNYLGFRNPSLFFEFKDRADAYAKALLRSDHPLGLLLMARMHSVGDVYEQDQIKAYAYAHAAALVGNDSGILEDAKSMKSWIEISMAPDQIPKAKKLAREILDER